MTNPTPREQDIRQRLAEIYTWKVAAWTNSDIEHLLSLLDQLRADVTSLERSLSREQERRALGHD